MEPDAAWICLVTEGPKTVQTPSPPEPTLLRRVWDVKSEGALATLRLPCNPHALAWHPGGRALVHTNREDDEADRVALTDYHASPARLKAASDRQITTDDEARAAASFTGLSACKEAVLRCGRPATGRSLLTRRHAPPHQPAGAVAELCCGHTGPTQLRAASNRQITMNVAHLGAAPARSPCQALLGPAGLLPQRSPPALQRLEAGHLCRGQA